MTLNEAIREGCRVLPQQTEDEGACVLRAAAQGADVRSKSIICPNELPYTELVVRFPQLSDTATCPVGRIPGTHTPCIHLHKVYQIMYHLNDTHSWSREAIAEWADPHPELHLPMPSLVNAPSEPTVRCAT